MMFRGKRFDKKEFVEGDLVHLDTIHGQEFIIVPTDAQFTSVDDYCHHNDEENPLTISKWYKVVPESIQKLSGGIWWGYDYETQSIHELGL